MINFVDTLRQHLSNADRAKGYLDVALEEYAIDLDSEERFLWGALRSVIEFHRPESSKWQMSKECRLNAEEVILLNSINPCGWHVCKNFTEFSAMAAKVSQKRLGQVYEGKTDILDKKILFGTMYTNGYSVLGHEQDEGWSGYRKPLEIIKNRTTPSSDNTSRRNMLVKRKPTMTNEGLNRDIGRHAA